MESNNYTFQYPEFKNIITGRLSLDEWIKRNYPDFYNYLITNYTETQVFKEKIYMFYHNMVEIPRCKTCGKKVKFHGYMKGWGIYCCPTCAQQDPEVRKKHDITCIERHGEDYKQKIAIKTKQTKKERYGDEGYSNKIKAKQTKKEKYGDENYNNINKIIETNMKKYGAMFKILSPEYVEDIKLKRKEKTKQRNPEIIEFLNNGKIVKCKCTDQSCALCKERIYEIPYDMFYERKYVYGIDTCIKKVPKNSTVCGNKNTDLEKFVADILDKEGVEYVKNDRDVLDGRELDIWIPKHMLAIECNGVYWHNDDHTLKDYHINKFKECERRGIKLLTIWEDWIKRKPEIVRDIIRSSIGVVCRKIGGRECEVREVERKECEEFLEKYHLQGSVRGEMRIGLYTKKEGEIVGVMVWGRKRVFIKGKEEGVWELYRLCTKGGVVVRGGVSKMLKYFIDNYKPKKIVSFSMNDISNGRVYKQLGMKEVGETVGYWYIWNNKRYHRWMFTKKKLVEEGEDKNMTEKEIMRKRGANIIYDSGQKKWIIEL